MAARRAPLAVALVLLVLATAGRALAAGFEMFATSSASTGEKPQSKVWYHDGSYWCVLKGPDGVAIYEKVGDGWVRGVFMDAVLTSSGKADVKWDGTSLFVLVYTSSPKVFKYSYDATSRVWLLVTGFPVSVPNPSGSETMVLEEDSTGRLWTTAEGNNSVNVYYSTSADQRTWSSAPIVLRTGINSDDISSVVAFGGNKIGVFWSDQNRDEFGFRVHHDGAPPADWDAVEIANSGSGHADDHVNLAFDTSGRVYAITKDDSDKMRVLRRNLDGTWTVKNDVLGGTATRGIIMVAEEDAKVYVLYTRWGVSPNPIQYKVASMTDLVFGSSTTFISSSSNMNNVTGMKQILPKGSLVALAENGSKALWNGWGSPPSGQAQPPGPPLALTATLQQGGTTGALGLPFDEGGGQLAHDLSANGNDARLGSTTGVDAADPAWVAGVTGSALQFDGASDYVEVADAPSLDMPNGFTVEGWVKRAASSGGCLVNKGVSGARTYRVLVTTSGGVEFLWEDTGAVKHETVSSSGLVPEASWHHVACVYDPVAAKNRIYIDGALRTSSSASGTPAANAKTLSVGARLSSYWKDFFKGSIDLVRLSAGVVYTGNFTPPVSFGNGPAVVQLAWQPPATGTPAGYNVYRQVGSQAYAKLNASLVTATACTDPAPPASGSACYVVTAVTALAQEGAPSDPACVQLGAALAAGQAASGAAVEISRGALLNAAPNPFNPETIVSFRLPAPRQVLLAVYDAGGRRVATLVDASLGTGEHTARWRGRSEDGSAVASGVYFVALRAGEIQERRKLVLLK